MNLESWHNHPSDHVLFLFLISFSAFFFHWGMFKPGAWWVRNKVFPFRFGYRLVDLAVHAFCEGLKVLLLNETNLTEFEYGHSLGAISTARHLIWSNEKVSLKWKWTTVLTLDDMVHKCSPSSHVKNSRIYLRYSNCKRTRMEASRSSQSILTSII